MTIGDILQDAVDQAFEIQGLAATYTPDGGSPVSVHVIPRPHVNVDAVLPLGRKPGAKA